MCRAWENSINNAKNEGRLEGELEGKIKGKIETLYEECDMSIPDIAKKGGKTGRVCQRGYKEIDSGVFVGMKILSKTYLLLSCK